MGRVTVHKVASERQKDLREAEQDYIAGLEPSIYSAARTYGVPYRTLRGCLQGANLHANAHSQEQILSVEEEKAIVWLYATLDDWGHPLQGSLVKAFMISLLPHTWWRQLGNHWLTCFLNRNAAIVSKFNQHLDCQWANPSNPAILKNYFHKVFILYHIMPT